MDMRRVMLVSEKDFDDDSIKPCDFRHIHILLLLLSVSIIPYYLSFVKYLDKIFERGLGDFHQRDEFDGSNSLLVKKERHLPDRPEKRKITADLAVILLQRASSPGVPKSGQPQFSLQSFYLPSQILLSKSTFLCNFNRR